MVRYRHPKSGNEIDVLEAEFSKKYAAEGYVPVTPQSIHEMTRAELDEHAATRGIADAASLPTKAAVIDAIERAERGPD